MKNQHSVIVIDMYSAPDPENDSITYRGFPDQAAAIAFATARLRDSIEELRRPNMSAEDLRTAWSMFGEDAVTDGFQGTEHLDAFIEQPASPEQRDWQSLLPPRHANPSRTKSNPD